MTVQLRPAGSYHSSRLKLPRHGFFRTPRQMMHLVSAHFTWDEVFNVLGKTDCLAKKKASKKHRDVRATKKWRQCDGTATMMTMTMARIAMTSQYFQTPPSRWWTRVTFCVVSNRRCVVRSMPSPMSSIISFWKLFYATYSERNNLKFPLFPITSDINFPM